jgi:hypothetical protein
MKGCVPSIYVRFSRRTGPPPTGRKCTWPRALRLIVARRLMREFPGMSFAEAKAVAREAWRLEMVEGGK